MIKHRFTERTEDCGHLRAIGIEFELNGKIRRQGVLLDNCTEEEAKERLIEWKNQAMSIELTNDGYDEGMAPRFKITEDDLDREF